MIFFPVTKTGASLVSAASAIVTCPVPLTSDGKVAQFVKVRSTAPGFVKISETAGDVANTDTMVQVADALVMATSGMSYINFMALTTATAQVSPVEWGSYFPRNVTDILAKYGSNAHVYLPGVGAVTGEMLTGSVTPGNYLDSAGTTAATVDNPVGLVQDSFGAVNASQATTANKPILRRGLVNLQNKSGDISTWSSTNAGTITGGQSDPLGGTSAYLFSGAGKNVYLTNVTSVSGTCTFAFHIYSPIAGTINAGSAGGSGTLINVSAGWGIYVVTQTTLANDGCAIFLTGTLTSITVYRAGYFQGTVTAAQILATGGIPLTTSAAASSTLGNGAWEFNGSTNYLSLGAPLFQQADDRCVVAGYNATSGVIFDQSSGGGTPLTGRLQVDVGGLLHAYFRDDASTLIDISYNPGTSVDVVASARVVSGNRVLRTNGVQRGSNASALGATTITTAVIGGTALASPTSTLAGKTYPIVAIKGTVTDADLLTLERWVGSLSGVSF